MPFDELDKKVLLKFVIDFLSRNGFAEEATSIARKSHSVPLQTGEPSLEYIIEHYVKNKSPSPMPKINQAPKFGARNSENRLCTLFDERFLQAWGQAGASNAFTLEFQTSPEANRAVSVLTPRNYDQDYSTEPELKTE